jgi:hypothetical protein
MMRCRDVTRELAAPSGAIDSDALARHLAACPDCAAWSDRAERFDRLWEATRPAEPSAEAVDAMWARLCHALDEAPALPSAHPASVRARWSWAIALVGLAQAAAVLLAVWLAAFPRTPEIAKAPEPSQSAPAEIALADEPIDIEAGQVVFIRIEDGKGSVVLPAFESLVANDSVDPGYDVLNAVEGMAN